MKDNKKESISKNVKNVNNSFPICPISFINNDFAEPSTNVNMMFLYPYSSAISNQMALNSFMTYGNLTNIDEETKKIISKVSSEYERTRLNAIYSFIQMNATDLLINQLIKFVNNAFLCLDCMNTVSLFISNLFESKENTNIDDMMRIFKSDIVYFLHPHYLIKNDESKKDLVTLSMPNAVAQTMGIVTEIFNYIIIYSLNVTINIKSKDSVAFDLLYTFLFERCYDSKPTSIPNLDKEYSFSVAMLREIAIPYLKEIEHALILLCDIATRMYYDHTNNSLENKGYALTDKNNIYTKFEKTIASAFDDYSINDYTLDDSTELGKTVNEFVKNNKRALMDDDEEDGNEYKKPRPFNI